MKKKTVFFPMILFLSCFVNAYGVESGIIPGEYFGMHIHEIVNYDASLDLPLYAIRIWDAGVIWADIEKIKGQWDFSKLDAIVDLAVKNNLEITMTLGQTPGWASKKKNVYYPYGRTDILTSVPDDIGDWENYLRVIGGRYKGRIRYWEVWNEPDHLYFYSGTKKELAALTRSAWTILKSIDPENKIISPSITALPGSIGWLQGYLSAGAVNYVDIIGYHYYTLSWIPPEAIRDHLANIKSMMKSLKIGNKPIWTTEAGISFDKISDKVFVSYIARMYIIQKFYGSERFFWYAMDNSEMPKGGLLSADKTGLNAGGRAYKKISEWLIGKKIISIKYSGNLCVAEIRTAEGVREIIVWTTTGKADYKIPGGMTVNKAESLDDKKTEILKGRIRIGQIPVLIN
jgi:hypothetical protein